MDKVENLIISGLDKVSNHVRAAKRSIAIAQNYANVRDLKGNRVTVNWVSNTEAVAWSDNRKKLNYSFDD